MEYDLAIIGGGAAGLMAANRAGELGARTVVLEKNSQPGIKILLTGNGRCNLTNNIADHKILAGRYGANGKFLLSGFSKFDVAAAIVFFESRGVKTKLEDNGRVLPASDKAQDVLDALLKKLSGYGVIIRTKAAIAKIVPSGRKIEKIVLASGEEIRAKNYLVATGGKSYPLTGSTGDAYNWLRQLGHTITEIRPALVPLLVEDKFIGRLEGVSIKNAKLSVKREQRLLSKEVGDIIFTSSGVSGPAAINLSRLIVGQHLAGAELSIDFLPENADKELDEKLQAIWRQRANKALKNTLAEILPQKLVDLLLELAKIDGDKQANSVTREERKAIVSKLKSFRLEIKGLGHFDRAITTKGGVRIDEIDPKTMRSKLVDNLYLAGEIIDLDGPTGGFNLQMCWTTGYVAGENAAES